MKMTRSHNIQNFQKVCKQRRLKCTELLENEICHKYHMHSDMLNICKYVTIYIAIKKNMTFQKYTRVQRVNVWIFFHEIIVL